MTTNNDKPNTDAQAEAAAARRRFLSGAAAVTTLALAPGVTLIAAADAKEPHEPTKDSFRWGMLIDTTKCDKDCTLCVEACKTENGWAPPPDREPRPATDVQWIRKVNVTDPETKRSFSLPVMCQHCANAPCVDVCPTGASFTRMDGVTLVDKHLCIGCRYCMMACPYKARSFVHESTVDPKPHAPRGKGTVDACTMCVHRIDKGGIPACAEACIDAGFGAILFGDLNDPDSDIAKAVASQPTTQIRQDLGTEPGVFYQGI